MSRRPGPLSRLTVFGVVLFGAFGTAYAAGERLPGHRHPSGGAKHATIDESQPHTHDLTPRPAATNVDGYELRLDPVAADGHTLQYRVVGPGGAPVTAFLDNHGSKLHTVLIHSDLSGFQHIHPDLAADGTWRVTVPAGAWHLVFDVWPAGAATNIVLATNTDDEVPTPSAPLPGADDAPTVDGLTVRRNGLVFTISDADGTATTGLEPYLGAPGHLIAMRLGDLAYTHLHPSTTSTAMADMPGMTMPVADTPANVLTFTGSLTTGTYRVFLQFGHDGKVVTVPYTVVIP
ncbi:MAG: hypothetical protein JWM12_2568 [Ilumatobacteraceae bacterium]|nr:hypothetical protein [Ilumatobacteraceae bacterium]